MECGAWRRFRSFFRSPAAWDEGKKEGKRRRAPHSKAPPPPLRPNANRSSRGRTLGRDVARRPARRSPPGPSPRFPKARRGPARPGARPRPRSTVFGPGGRPADCEAPAVSQEGDEGLHEPGAEPGTQCPTPECWVFPFAGVRQLEHERFCRDRDEFPASSRPAGGVRGGRTGILPLAPGDGRIASGEGATPIAAAGGCPPRSACSSYRRGSTPGDGVVGRQSGSPMRTKAAQ